MTLITHRNCVPENHLVCQKCVKPTTCSNGNYVLKDSKFQPFKSKWNIKIKICEFSLKLQFFGCDS